MYRSPMRPQRSPGASRPAGWSPVSGWGFTGARSPFGSVGHRGASPQGFTAYCPGSPGSERGCRERSPSGFGSGPRLFGRQMHRRGGGFRRPQLFSPNVQFSDLPVEKYFNPSMLQDPWAALQPLTSTDAAATRYAM
ncbi:M-phase-specific PLK1-interacting protein [Betta splendens]|uniref:M-phase-specific PLK1-interacting protein n=1 Tax=Betta splendens TaxID=158456 RepID=A0A6P7L0J7_BETSP|nr:M-phase-specific PLK1-interacting protein [Betta splendens]